MLIMDTTTVSIYEIRGDKSNDWNERYNSETILGNILSLSLSLIFFSIHTSFSRQRSRIDVNDTG